MFNFVALSLHVLFASAQTFVLRNPFFYFGDLSENSVNSVGQLCQPWYLSPITNSWYKLTYANYPLDFAIKYNDQTKYIYDLSPIYSFDNYSLFNLKSNVSNVLQGSGTIVSDRLFPNFLLRNAYSLGDNDTFIRVFSTIVPQINVTNVQVYFGTRDDFVGTSDTNIKTRGNILNGAFVPTTNASNTIEVTNNVEGVLFYSTYSQVNAIFSSCCSFSNVYNTNPLSLSASTVTPTDGSYGLVLNVGNVNANASFSYTWYYSAGVLSSLANITNQIAKNVAPSFSSTVSATPSNTISVIIKNNMSNISLSATSTPLFIITPYPTTSPSASFNSSTIIVNNLADTSTATILGGTAVGLVAVMTGLLAAYHIKIPQNVSDRIVSVYRFVTPFLRRMGVDPVKMIQDKIGVNIVTSTEDDDNDVEKTDKKNVDVETGAAASASTKEQMVDKFKELLSKKLPLSQPKVNNDKSNEENTQSDK